jgi:hypothetical protein
MASIALSAPDAADPPVSMLPQLIRVTLPPSPPPPPEPPSPKLICLLSSSEELVTEPPMPSPPVPPPPPMDWARMPLEPAPSVVTCMDVFM